MGEFDDFLEYWDKKLLELEKKVSGNGAAGILDQKNKDLDPGKEPAVREVVLRKPAAMSAHRNKLHLHRLRIIKHYRTLKAHLKAAEEKRRKAHDKRGKLVKKLKQKAKWRLTFSEVLKAKEDEIEKLYMKLLETEEKYMELLAQQQEK